MSVVATPSVHALVRDFVASSPRRLFLPDPEGVELSNQAALMREVVVTVQACLAPDLARARQAERAEHAADPDWASGPGLHLVVAVAQYEEFLATLRDVTALVESGRTTTAWLLLGSAAERVRVLAALESPTGPRIARILATRSADARARLAAAAAADDVDLSLPPAIAPVAGAPAGTSGPDSDEFALPAPPPEIAELLVLVELGAATSRDGGPLDTRALAGSPDDADYEQLAVIGGYQTHLVFEMIRAATDSLCDIAGQHTRDDVWPHWSEDVRAAVEFAWDCV